MNVLVSVFDCVSRGLPAAIYWEGCSSRTVRAFGHRVHTCSSAGRTLAVGLRFSSSDAPAFSRMHNHLSPSDSAPAACTVVAVPYSAHSDATHVTVVMGRPVSAPVPPSPATETVPPISTGASRTEASAFTWFKTSGQRRRRRKKTGAGRNMHCHLHCSRRCYCRDALHVRTTAAVIADPARVILRVSSVRLD